jgi:DUF971 family protein
MSAGSIAPTKIERADPNDLIITWSDGKRLRYSASALRRECPCATCREKRTEKLTGEQTNPFQLTILKPEETIPLAIKGMKPVGTYAYTIDFTDGHNTGIYTFEFLRALGAPAENSPG